MAKNPSQTDLPEEELSKGDPPIRPQRKQSVVIYLVILFAAAFLLLLMAYFMQQRNSNAIIGNLQDSLTSFQTVDELRDENELLQEQISHLEDQLQQAQADLQQVEEAAQETAGQIEQLQRQLEALSLLSQAESLYYTGAPEDAAEVLQRLADQEDLIQALEEDQATRYRALQDSLIQAGYLEEPEG
ncbi:MAG TPA: hypothetical protein IAC25_05950 [Candidatus Enterenecus stercoripullorum]|nr:hypothetical protein [Candidatus Enterenecus stercoripullorum]